jgi:hypothetical protein
MLKISKDSSGWKIVGVQHVGKNLAATTMDRNGLDLNSVTTGMMRVLCDYS